MSADDMQVLREELAQMRRIVSTMGKMGRVAEVKKGRIRVVYGQGDGGDEGGKDTGVWIRTAHGGAQSEGRQWSKGETVSTWQVGGNPEHCMVHPSGWNDKHPRDGNDTDDNGTRRWRKPPKENENGEGNGGAEGGGGSEGSEGGGGGGGGSGGGGEEEGGFAGYGNKDKNDAPQWKDDKDDHQEINDHEKRVHKMGKYTYTGTKDGGTMDYDGTYVRNNKGKVEIGKGDDVHFVYEKGKITVKCDIVDKNGKKFAVQGTLTADGKPLVTKFANEA